MRGYSGYAFEDDVYHGCEDLSLPYLVNCCGYLKTEGTDVSLARCRKDYYIIYITNGRGHYKLDDKIAAADAGSVVIYKPGERQDYFYLGNENAELYWIHFTGSAVSQLLIDMSLINKNIIRVGIDSICINLFESIIHELQLKKPDFHPLCTGYLIQLLALFSRKAALLESGERGFKSNHIDQVVSKMHADYMQRYDMDYYAGLCNLSVFYFIRSFKRIMGISPGAYVEKIRINKAKELLLNTSLTINEVSGMVGYSEPYYFSKVFKKISGITPTGFRNVFPKAAEK